MSPEGRTNKLAMSDVECGLAITFWVSQRAGVVEGENLKTRVSHVADASKLACGRALATYVPLGAEWPAAWPLCQDCNAARPEVAAE